MPRKQSTNQKVCWSTALCIGLTANSLTAAANMPAFQDQSYRYQDCEGKAAIARVPLFADGPGGEGATISKSPASGRQLPIAL